MKAPAALLIIALANATATAAVQEAAHYSLKGAGGVRDTAGPETLKDQAGKAPDLKRQGSPKVMSNGPEARRQAYDSSIKFEEPSQCYSVARNLISGDDFVVEAWAYALKGNAGGWHAVVASGNGASGFLLGQNDNQWSVLVGGVGSVNLGTVQPETWTHLAKKSLDRYERQFFSLLSSGAQVGLTGPRLYDGPNSQAMLKKWMTWYRRYRAIIQGDIIHLRRPDGRGPDYYLHVNPSNKEKGMLLVFNPLNEAAKKELTVPLYYTGLTDTARIREQEGQPQTYQFDREFNVRVPLTIPANGYSWFSIE
ncbi:MAG: hypothetical protein NTW21_29605 [Verrucomicrobia bacterium]|nr:hypothetical protein [Verrucomicrobiota bacterium]